MGDVTATQLLFTFGLVCFIISAMSTIGPVSGRVAPIENNDSDDYNNDNG